MAAREAASENLSKINSEVWLSLVERYVRDVEAASSNLVTSIKDIHGMSFFNRDSMLNLQPIEAAKKSPRTVPADFPKNQLIYPGHCAIICSLKAYVSFRFGGSFITSF